MATLIQQGNRRCDATCYNGKGKHCECICGGKNHGKGFDQAKRNVIEMVEEHPELPAEVIPIPRDLALDQGFITGTADSREVYVAGSRLDPRRSQKVFNHSPDGFAWGYGGSGPAQLALAILLEMGVPQDRAVRWHQEFKREFIAALEPNFNLPLSIVRAFIENMRVIEASAAADDADREMIGDDAGIVEDIGDK